MHRSKLRKRLYNQAALLALQLAKESKQNVDVRGLIRHVASDGQAKRTRSQRLRLPANHFQASSKVKGRHILLIDDIYTTGATAKACALALKRGGALSVSVFTIAYTPASHD